MFSAKNVDAKSRKMARTITTHDEGFVHIACSYMGMCADSALKLFFGALGLNGTPLAQERHCNSWRVLFLLSEQHCSVGTCHGLTREEQREQREQGWAPHGAVRDATSRTTWTAAAGSGGH